MFNRIKNLFLKEQLPLAIRKNPSLTFVRFDSPSRLQSFIAACICIVTILYLYRAALPVFNSDLIGGFLGDPGLYVWLLQQKLQNFFLGWFESSAFYPYGKTIAWSDNYIIPTILASFLQMSGLSLPTTWNVLLFLTTFLTGFCTFRLLFGLTAHFYVSIAAAILSMTLLPVRGHLGHPQLQHIFVFPLFFIFLFNYLKHRSWKYSMFLSMLIPMTFLISVYYALFLTLLFFVVFGVLFLLRPIWPHIDDIPRLGIPASIFAVIVTVFCIPYFEVKSAFGNRGLYESYYFSAKPISYIASTGFSKFYSALAGLSHSEAHLFPGFFIFALSIYGLGRILDAKQVKPLFLAFLTLFIWSISFASLSPSVTSTLYIASIFSWFSIGTFICYLFYFGRLELKYFGPQLTNRSIILIFYFTACIFYFMSIGPLGNPEHGQLATGPFAVVYFLIPGFDSLRAVGRFGIIVSYFLLIIAALTAWQLLSRNKKHRLIICLFALGAFIENQLSVFPLEKIPPSPPILSELTPKSSNTITIGLPLVSKVSSTGEVVSWTDYAMKSVQYMSWFSESTARTINGYSGQKSKLMKELPRELKDFPDKRSFIALKHFAGLSQVFYFSKFAPSFDPVSFEAKAKITQGLSEFTQDNDGNYRFSVSGELYSAEPFELLVHPSAFHMHMHVKSTRPGKIQVFAKDPATASPLVSTEIFPERFTVVRTAIPPPNNSVRPIRLMVQMEDKSPFYLGETKVVF